MNINATLFVQACNFFIVYWMLRVFLFKPTICLIERETIQKNTILNTIEQQKKSLEIQEKERQKHWYNCQTYFALHQPKYVRKVFANININLDTPSQETSLSHTLEHDVSKIHDILKEKIRNVH